MGHNTRKTKGAVLCVVRRLASAVGGHFEFREYIQNFPNGVIFTTPFLDHILYILNNNKQHKLFHTNSRACVLPPRRMPRSPAIEI